MARKEVASEETGEDEKADDGVEGDDICSSHFFLFLRSFLMRSMKSGWSSGRTSRKVSSGNSCWFSLIIFVFFGLDSRSVQQLPQ